MHHKEIAAANNVFLYLTGTGRIFHPQKRKPATLPGRPTSLSCKKGSLKSNNSYPIN